MRWRKASEAGGAEALRPKPAPGRPPKLTTKQKRRLVRCLLEGPTKHGYRTDLWTTRRVAELIEAKFGIAYHRDHVGRLLHALGWTGRKAWRTSSRMARGLRPRVHTRRAALTIDPAPEPVYNRRCIGV